MFWKKKKQQQEKTNLNTYENIDKLFKAIKEKSPEVGEWLDIVNEAIYGLGQQIKQLEDNEKKILELFNTHQEILDEMCYGCDCEDCSCDKEEKGSIN
jgi:hypothetical protein